MLVLRFDSDAMFKDLCGVLLAAANEAMEHFLKTAQLNLKAKDAETQAAILDMADGKISATCVFYARSILESYGRGQQMDEFNPYLETYFGNELLGWNPLRKDKRIVGRKQGYYINFLGELAYSEGKMAGKVTSRDVGYVVQPSRAIQNAEKLLDAGLKNGGYVMRILRLRTEEFFDNIDSSKYFYNEEV